MSKELLRLPASIRRSAIDYIKTAYRTNDRAFNDARDQLLSDGAVSEQVFAEPVFELIPRYAGSSMSMREVLGATFAQAASDSSAAAQAFDPGIELIRSEFDNEPYLHQLEALRATLIEKRDIVVTTGTGSGKSLCFILPLIANLLMESIGTQGRRRWKSRRSERDWWKSGENPYVYRRGSDRTAAVRGLVIYPLNALVRDQIEAMRGLLDSPAAESFYRGVIGEERIYFGQNLGATPGSADADNIIFNG